MKKRSLALICSLLVLALLALSGCQAVGGVNLDQALINSIQLQSYEGAQSISLDLDLDKDGQILKETPQMAMFASSKLVFSDIKMQDKETMSMSGKWQFNNGKSVLPFKISLDRKQLALAIEGAQKPLVIDLAAAQKQPNGESLPFDVSKLGDPNELVRKFAPFVIKHLPNPKTIQVTPTIETVNGIQIKVNKIHSEIKGSEVAGLLKEMVDSLVADEQGFTDFLKEIMQLVQGDKYDDMTATIMIGAARQMLVEASGKIEEELSSDEAKQVLNDNNYLKSDLYIDSDLNTLKSNMELSIVNPKDGESGFKGLKLATSAEVWNINKPVTAALIDTAQGALAINEDFRSGHFIKNLDTSSALYKLLVDELKVTNKNVTIYVGEEPDAYFPTPYIDPESETLMLPVRFVSEKLDADVKWDGDAKQVTVTEILTGRTAVFTIDSDTALVDGTSVKLDEKAKLAYGSVYVPGRVIIENLFKATISWDNANRTISIVKQ